MRAEKGIYAEKGKTRQDTTQRRNMTNLVGPVNPDSSGSEPLAVHGGDGLLSIGLVSEGEETVTPALACVNSAQDNQPR